MKANLRSLSKPVHALLSCTNSIKHAFPSILQLDASPHTQRFRHTQAEWQPICLCWPPKHTDIYTQPVPHQNLFPSYQWCSVLRSIPDCIHICRPCKCHAHCSVGDTPSGHTQSPSSRRHSDRCLKHKFHGHHSPLHKSLWETGTQKKTKNVLLKNCITHSATRLSSPFM